MAGHGTRTGATARGIYRDARACRVAVAPMMDWTDRHCRYFHRLLAPSALLYTEMVVADAVIHGDRNKLLGFDTAERPLALQLGGSEPEKLAEAARIGEAFGYDEINLNCGCPSDRVQSGAFGACLMTTPELVGDCVAAMRDAVSLPVTVKCRIGVDDQDPGVALDRFADIVLEAGADALWVHARKAWLQGLSPRENRDIPPLDYGRVERLKSRYPDRFIGINGGIRTPAEAEALLRSADGVMIGRAAYQTPALLPEFSALAGDPAPHATMGPVIEAMVDYASSHIAAGGRLAQVTRHMLGLFHGEPGARRYRQILSTEANLSSAGTDVLRRAYGAVAEAGERAAA